MIPFSYPVGIIPKQELKEFMTIGDEVFYKLDATFKDVPMEVIISKYVWSDDLFGKVGITGYPTVYRDEENRFVLAWQAHLIKIVDEDTPENNDVTIQLHVSRVQPMTLSRNGGDLLKFIGTQCTFNKKLVVLYCVAKDQYARRLSKLRPKDILVGKGSICMHRGYRNIMITEVTSCKRETGSLNSDLAENSAES